MNKLYTTTLSIFFIGTSLPISSTRIPLKKIKKQEAVVAPLSNEESQYFQSLLKPIIKHTVDKAVEKKLKEFQEANSLQKNHNQEEVDLSQEDARTINILRATLRLEQEVQSKNVKHKTNPTLVQAIENGYEEYQIISKGETLNWSSMLTGELFSLIWHRWQYKMRNTITVNWKDKGDSYGIVIATNSSSDNIGNSVRCDIAKKLRKTENFTSLTARSLTEMTGDCYGYGCEKKITIRCQKAILRQLIRDHENSKK